MLPKTLCHTVPVPLRSLVHFALAHITELSTAHRMLQSSVSAAGRFHSYLQFLRRNTCNPLYTHAILHTRTHTLIESLYDTLHIYPKNNCIVLGATNICHMVPLSSLAHLTELSAAHRTLQSAVTATGQFIDTSKIHHCSKYYVY
jgi:hypothetical protein